MDASIMSWMEEEAYFSMKHKNIERKENGPHRDLKIKKVAYS